jgi:hypothetical protein
MFIQGDYETNLLSFSAFAIFRYLGFFAVLKNSYLYDFLRSLGWETLLYNTHKASTGHDPVQKSYDTALGLSYNSSSVM